MLRSDTLLSEKESVKGCPVTNSITKQPTHLSEKENPEAQRGEGMARVAERTNARARARLEDRPGARPGARSGRTDTGARAKAWSGAGAGVVSLWSLWLLLLWSCCDSISWGGGYVRIEVGHG